jgi:hypothetical protein
MKKKYYSIIAICLISLGLTAQPVITYNGNAPQIGETFYYSGDLGAYDPGPSGANQNWDFSDTPSSFFTSAVAVNPGSTPFADDFPEATIAFDQNGDGETYIYSQISPTEMLNVGLGNITGSGGDELVIHYTDAVKLLQYPFSYSDTYTDTYFTSYSLMAEMVTHEWGDITVIADAWGNISTPEGTYNTLRVKSERVYTDSIWVSGVFINTTTHVQTDYNWYTSTSHTPVFSISVTEDGTTVSYRTNLTDAGEQQFRNVQVDIFPNPVTDNLTIQSEKALSSIWLLSVNGRQMDKISFGTALANQYNIELGMYPKGVYFIKLKFDDGSILTKKVIR